MMVLTLVWGNGLWKCLEIGLGNPSVLMIYCCENLEYCCENYEKNADNEGLPFEVSERIKDSIGVIHVIYFN